MPARTPEERALVAERWAHTPDRTQATQYLRDARRAKIAAAITAEIDELPPTNSTAASTTKSGPTCCGCR